MSSENSVSSADTNSLKMEKSPQNSGKTSGNEETTTETETSPAKKAEKRARFSVGIVRDNSDANLMESDCEVRQI